MLIYDARKSLDLLLHHIVVRYFVQFAWLGEQFWVGESDTWVNREGKRWGGGGGEGEGEGGPAMETLYYSEEKAKKMNAKVGADKPVDPSHPRVAACKFEFLFINPHFYDHFNGTRKSILSFTDRFLLSCRYVLPFSLPSSTRRT